MPRYSSAATSDAASNLAAAPRGRRAPAVAAALLFAALAALHTWPLASAPGRLSRNDTGDAVLNEWAVAWVAHQVLHDPLHLFDANIFYPERRTLAFSEHMLPQSLMVAPVSWGGGSPVLAHNLALLAGLALTGWAFFYVAWKWTGWWTAGVVAGSLAAFNAHSLTRLSHLQAQHIEFLPLALLALDRLLSQPRVRHALWLACWFTLQALTSGYFLVFSAVAVVAAAAARPADFLGRSFWPVMRTLAIASGTAGLALLPFLLPYWQVRREQGLVRSLEEVAKYSASLTDYLATGGLLHWSTWSASFFRGDALFPGAIGLGLALTGLLTGVALRDRRARMCLVVALAAFALSFGARLPVYAWLYRAIPLFEGIRGAVRFGQLALVALALVGGFGAAWWLARVERARTRAALAAALILGVNVEAWRGPLGYTVFHGIAPIHRTLERTPPDAVIAYFPMYSGPDINQNARYMLASTANWRRMLNGYSGFTPVSFRKHAEVMRTFPDERSLEYLRRVGVTHVAVDGRNVAPEHRVQMMETPGLVPWASDGNLQVFALR